MLVHDLFIENYRSFESYRLNAMTRVNLLVGKNNCGKTSVLEALELLQSGCDTTTLLNAAQRRGELHISEDDDSQMSRTCPEIFHMFRDRRVRVGTRFRIEGNSQNYVAAEIFDPMNPDELRALTYREFRDVPSEFALELSAASEAIETRKTRVLPLTAQGFVPIGIVGNSRLGRDPRGSFNGTTFVTANSLDIRSMAAMWDQVTADSRENEVELALQLLEPNLRDIRFKASDQAYRAGSGGILLGIGNDTRRQPLGSYGEGMRRMLGLAIALVCSSNGILLIDEIDTGLHYSVLGQMWEFLAETARKFNVQVVATTHSLDCIRAMTTACDFNELLREDIALFTIDRRMDEAVKFGGAELPIVSEHEIEVR